MRHRQLNKAFGLRLFTRLKSSAHGSTTSMAAVIEAATEAVSCPLDHDESGYISFELWSTEGAAPNG